MIILLSGQPGHGKTLRALVLASEFKKEGRAVYVEGIRDIDLGKTGFLALENPKAWEDLPDGSVILVDECYRHFPNRAAQSRTPDYIEAMARHRHRGFDFILICQDPSKQLDPFLRGLVDTHTHVRRKFGTHTVVLKTWDHFQGAPLANDGRNVLWRYPKEVFTWYTSATQHTVKRSIPLWIFFVIPLVVFVFYVSWHLSSGEFLNNDGIVTSQAAAGGPAPAGQTAAGMRNTDEYLSMNIPRVKGQPWTAPVFDEREVVTNPDIYCMSSEIKCTCLTEQGTTYFLEAKICRSIARHGNYNPFREPPAQTRSPGEAELELVDQVSETSGSQADPGRVGDPQQGQVWGNAPATLRASQAY